MLGTLRCRSCVLAADLGFIRVTPKSESTAHESLQNKTDNLEWNQLTQFTELTQLRLDFVLSSAECRLQSQPGNARVCYPRRDRNTDLI